MSAVEIIWFVAISVCVLLILFFYCAALKISDYLDNYVSYCLRDDDSIFDDWQIRLCFKVFDFYDKVVGSIDNFFYKERKNVSLNVIDYREFRLQNEYLNGIINSIYVTDDLKELLQLREIAFMNIDRICDYKKAQLECLEKEEGELNEQL